MFDELLLVQCFYLRNLANPSETKAQAKAGLIADIKRARVALQKRAAIESGMDDQEATDHASATADAVDRMAL